MSPRDLITRASIVAWLILATLFGYDPHLAGLPIQPWVTLFLVLIVPGFLLARILFADESGLGLAEFPVVITFSLALWAIPAALVRLIHSDWEQFRILFVAILWAMGIVYLIVQSTRRTRNLKIQLSSTLKVEWILLAFAIVVAVLVARGPRDSDDWFNLAIVQQLIKQDTFTSLESLDARYGFRYATHVWLFLQAFLAQSTGFDPVTLVRDVLPVFLAPLSLFGWYAWTKEFTGKAWAGLLAICFQLLLYATFLTSEGWGRGFFARIAQDKFLVGFLILPLAFLFFWRYMSAGRWLNWAAFGLCVLAMIFVHPIGLAQVGAAVGGFAVFNLLMRDRFPLHRWALVSLWLAPGLIVAVILKFVSPANLFSVDEQAGAYLRLSQGRLIFELPDFYLAHPDLVAHPLILFGLVLLPLLIPPLTKDRRAQFLWGSTLVPLALLYNPQTAWLLGEIITPWQLWRLTWILPVPLTVAYLASIWDFRHSPQMQWAARYAGVAVLIALLLGDLNAQRSLKYLSTSHMLNPQTEDLMRALPRYLSEPSIIVLPTDMSRLAPAFSANARLASPGAYQPEDFVGQQITEFYKSDSSPDQLVEFVNAHHARFLVLLRKSRLDAEIRQKLGLFIERYSNRDYVLYEVAQLVP